MKYKGYKIDERINDWKNTRLSKYCSDSLNTISLTSEDLRELLTIVEEKEKELEGTGIPHDDICVTIVMTGDNGGDWDISFETELSWSEPESDEKAKRRIEKIKRRIDKGIEIERKKSLEKAIKLVEESGFTVK